MHPFLASSRFLPHFPTSLQVGAGVIFQTDYLHVSPVSQLAVEEPSLKPWGKQYWARHSFKVSLSKPIQSS